ncbi:hypothetical protein UCRPA7_1377 [Phaeoacremonium minimum UCRPA7]|uniref:N-acetyltransferase domain-containing protein n=1 Tax=Phaeoacremonium minimum (strain UCR-PA7) TaxID=1286976 RepID=R8BUZ3_PHAM7|nr:hypothetical protein UCRPA7_1377 [Phaeoacremonium minimum UCRPA7]EOO03140.1 hypothetical protein UCRPA7_1377 [Phaeoacremonium minimum UCRPA7]
MMAVTDSKPSSKVTLIPWDYESEQHAERMVAQRIACGWRSDEVELWRDLGRKGIKEYYWIEASPIKDIASIEWLKPREPSNAEFIPVGHIALDIREEENAHLGITDEGVVWVAGLYISWVLQGAGIGRAVMQAAEDRAASDILKAKVMVLDTMTTDQQMRPVFIEKVYTQRGLPAPVVSNQSWYEKQGYVVFKHQEAGYMWPNPATGEKDPIDLMFLKKALV